MAEVVITGSGLGNDGRYTMGRIVDDQNARIDGAGLTTESGLSYDILTSGSCVGEIRIGTQGDVFFDATGSVHTFEPSDAGTHLRRPYPGTTQNQVFRIQEVLTVGATTARIADLHRTTPLAADPDHSAPLSNDGGKATVTLAPAALSLTDTMFLNRRVLIDNATARKDLYYMVITSGANNGERRLLLDYTDTYLILEGSTWTVDASATFYIEEERSPDVVPETSNWEHVKNQVILSGADLDLSNTPTQDAGTVNYTAYGVREPIDPVAETIDIANGDTEYSLGMPDPRPAQGRTRTPKETDMREDPIQIKETPAP